MNWLITKLENIPADLTSIDRWVVCNKEKQPFNANYNNSKASVNRPNSWSSFSTASKAYKENNWSGLGFVLNGDGIAGIDIDKCIKNNEIAPEALIILQKLNCPYIEISPSGSGLRGFGFAKPIKSGVKGTINNLNIELYTSGRYLTVTGHYIKKESFRELVGFKELAMSIRNNTEETEDTEETDINSSASSVNRMNTWPEIAIPKFIGERNKRIFQLARWLKGKEPNASRIRQECVLKEWFRCYLDIIGTKDFEDTWVDWVNSWQKIKYPYDQILNQCISQLPELPNPLGIENYSEKGKKLLQICIALQNYHKEDEFFISSRKAAELIDTNHTKAASLLRSFVNEEWLILKNVGSGIKASRYMINDEKLKDKIQT